MLSRRVATAAVRLPRTTLGLRAALPAASFSSLRPLQALDPNDPEMNGGYVNPPRVNRQNRDPYGEYWDKQERRNFGEPVHEDNDVLGIFSLEEYKHMTSGRAFFLWGCFISTVLGLVYAVKQVYPDRPSAPKEYEDGLEAELGGPAARRAFMAGDESK